MRLDDSRWWIDPAMRILRPPKSAASLIILFIPFVRLIFLASAAVLPIVMVMGLWVFQSVSSTLHSWRGTHFEDSTLVYTLPTTVTSGDVFLYEIWPLGGPNQIFSDLIRFNQNQMYFFSDLHPDDGPPFDLADVVGMPLPDATRPTRFIDELGPEGNNGAIYRPLTPSDPGFAGGVGPNVTYNFISDVPEPTSLSLLGLAGVAVLLRRRR